MIPHWKEIFSGVTLLGRKKGQAIGVSLILLLFVHHFFLVAFIALSKPNQVAIAGSFQNTFPDYNKEKRCIKSQTYPLLLQTAAEAE